MKELPNSLWAAVFIVLACIMGSEILHSSAPDNVKMGVLTMASSIVTGAFGYIQGVKDGQNSQNPTNPNQK